MQPNDTGLVLFALGPGARTRVKYQAPPSNRAVVALQNYQSENTAHRPHHVVSTIITFD